MRTLILIFTFMLIFFTSAIGEIYSWKDKNGRTVYGDDPPENIVTKTFTPEPLMIVPGYKDPVEDEKDAAEKETNKLDDGNETKEEADDKEEETDEPPYATFKITYPTKNDVIRANDGNIFISLHLSPALAASDSVYVYVNGKKVVEGSKALSVQLEQLDRGKQSIFAVVRNDNGDVLINSNTVTFSVLRSSAIQ
jgi:negative regulator of genetic competence, sporulation and motility